MSFEKEVEELTIEQLVYIADNYYSGSDYIRKLKGHKQPSGRAVSAINKKLKEFDFEWKERSNTRKLITKSCPVCKKEFKTFKTGDKEERTTCGYSCSNTYFRSGKNNGMYKHGTGVQYRNRAFVELGKICNRCSIDDIDVLVVHHKDRNRNNNDINNLEVLCANCHMKEHKTLCSSV